MNFVNGRKLTVTPEVLEDEAAKAYSEIYDRFDTVRDVLYQAVLCARELKDTRDDMGTLKLLVVDIRKFAKHDHCAFREASELDMDAGKKPAILLNGASCTCGLSDVLEKIEKLLTR
jgi:hypothetical protein